MKTRPLAEVLKQATPGPCRVDNDGETCALRAPDESRLAQLTYLAKARRRTAEETNANALMFAHFFNNGPKLVEALEECKTYFKTRNLGEPANALLEKLCRIVVEAKQVQVPE